MPKISELDLNLSTKNRCEVCGKSRGGVNVKKHAKCSEIRKARGFP